jgi:hypothetical protein
MGNDLKIIGGLKSLGDMLVDALVDEFIAQGHNNTGEFVKSITYAVNNFAQVISLNLYFNKYGVFLDKGVTAQRVPFSAGSGARSSKYITALTKWVRQRGFVTSLKQAKSMAFAIAKKHKKEGMPSRNSYKYSINGRRTDFFTYTIENKQDEIDSRIYELAGEFLFAIAEDSINQIQSQYNGTIKRAA